MERDIDRKKKNDSAHEHIIKRGAGCVGTDVEKYRGEFFFFPREGKELMAVPGKVDIEDVVYRPGEESWRELGIENGREMTSKSPISPWLTRIMTREWKEILFSS